MNVNATIARAAVLRFHSAQPDDARNDCVPTRDVHAHDFARWNPILDNRTRRQFVAEFAGHKQSAERRAVTAGGIADPKFGSRNRITRNQMPVMTMRLVDRERQARCWYEASAIDAKTANIAAHTGAERGKAGCRASGCTGWVISADLNN